MNRTARLIPAFLVAITLAATASADVELEVDLTVCASCELAHDGRCNAFGDVEEPFYREAPAETIDGPPEGLETHPVFRGSRSGAPRVGFDLRVMFGSMHSDFEFESADGNGTEIAVDEDLPIDDEAGAVELSVWIKLNEFLVINAGYLGGEYEGDGDVQSAFVHDDVAFEAGDPVDVYHSIELGWIGARILAVDEPRVKFGIPVGALWVSSTLDIEHQETLVKAEGQIEQWSPYLGIYLDLGFGHGFGVEAEVRFFAWGEEDDKLFGYFDAQANLYMTIADHIRIFVGGRMLAIDYIREEENDRTLEYRLGAVMAGVSIYY